MIGEKHRSCAAVDVIVVLLVRHAAVVEDVNGRIDEETYSAWIVMGA